MKVIIALLLLSSIVFAKEYPKVLSLYSNSEIREMASAYKIISNRSDTFDPVENMVMLMKSTEFRGYIIGILEAQGAFLECARSKSIQELTYRASIMIVDASPNSLEPSTMTSFLALKFACDDSKWKK